MRLHVILSVFKRNFASYFSGALGYLFIVVFVVAGAFLAFSPRFFTANEPSLDQLNEWFPMLLLFLIPAITMSSWADEKKQGTDELLFTLPAKTSEILVGKYLAVLGVYVVALMFSLTHVLVLARLGGAFLDVKDLSGSWNSFFNAVDMGQIGTTYFGYFLTGAALLAAGMLASAFTGSATVAFILGVAICAIPVFIGELGSLVNAIATVAGIESPTLNRFATGASDFFGQLSITEKFRDFGLGIIPLSSLFYFVALTIFMLYLNYVVITKRHWKRGRAGSLGPQFFIRAICLAVLLCSVAYLFGKTALQQDMTGEKLYSLSDSTKTIIDNVEKKRPITIQAFVSEEVPREYSAARKRLLGLLSQYDRRGGNRITVRNVPVTPYSKEAEEASHFGISPVRVMTDRDGRRTEEQVFLGAVVTSSYDEVVVPFFGKGLPIEYELTRSVQTVAKADRLTVGILRTDANMLSGSNEWQIVTELKKQYDVEEVTPVGSIDPDKYDVLIAVMPSSLTDPQMKSLVEYVAKGRATLIFDDPCPLMFSNQFGLSSAPRMPKPRPGGGGMMGMQQPPPEQKHANGKATDLLNELDLVWDNGRAIFDNNNPHAEFAMLPPEYVFLTPSNHKQAFNPDSQVTAGLQEVVAIYSGTVQHRKRNADLEFTPLLVSSGQSGLMDWDNYTAGGFNPFSMSPSRQVKPNPLRVVDKSAHALAAHITSDVDGSEKNVIFVADVDMIADLFFQEWNRGELPVEFDNVTFVLNAVDVLAKEESFVALRRRRAKNRTLTTVKQLSETFVKAQTDEEKKADADVKDALKKARASFTERRKKIEEDTGLDANAQQRLLSQIKQTEERKLEVLEANLENEKQSRIQKAKAFKERSIRALQAGIKWRAVLLPALLPIIVGMLMLGIRMASEKGSITEARRR